MATRIIGENIYCGLDLGSSKIKAGVVKIKNINLVDLLGVYEISTRGIKGTSVSETGDLAECVFQAVSEASKKAGVKVKDIQLGLGGEFVEHRLSQARIPLLDKGSKVVSAVDVKKVNHQARLLGIKMDEEVLHDFPQNYTLDDQTFHLHPVGLSARKLAVDVLLTIMNTIRVERVIKAINQAKFDVQNISYSSYAASHSSLENDMKMQGCVLIDIGANFSNVLVFQDGFLKSVLSVPIGGDHATRNISQNLHMSFDLADDIKRSYGVALSVDQDAHASKEKDKKDKGVTVSTKLEGFSSEKVLVKNENGYVPVKREVICQLLEPEISRLVTAISKSIKTFSKESLQGGIIIVGGGSLLPGLLERIEGGTGLTVSLGKINVQGGKLNNAATFSPAVGLAVLGFTKSFIYNISELNHKRWLQSFSCTIKELYQEYF